MDPVFDAQFLMVKESFAREGIQIGVAYKPDGEPDYLYERGHLLIADTDDNFPRLEGILRGLRRTDPETRARTGDLVVVSLADVEDGTLTVPDAMERIAGEIGHDNLMMAEGGVRWVTPVSVLSIQRLCAPTEPSVPCECPPQPCPGPRPAGEARREVRIGVSDTGLVKPPDPAHGWMAGVDGEDDPQVQTLPDGRRVIQEYGGHGTFVAGVARCMAPGAGVYVNNHFTLSGAEREDVIIHKLEQLITDYSPDVVNLSAGTYTRGNWAPLSFFHLHERHHEFTLVAAAGNDSTDREFFPAALDWVVGVGAIGADRRHRAWFSNYGDWVDVYAPGEGLVNAYATGEYTYHEPPKRPARQDFTGMARWDGTSFSAPLVAGLIAAEMSRTGDPAPAARDAVLAAARDVNGFGPVLLPPDE
jgi:subtilisin family serine protease